MQLSDNFCGQKSVEENNRPHPSDYTICLGAQVTHFLGSKCTLPAHVPFVTHQILYGEALPGPSLSV